MRGMFSAWHRGVPCGLKVFSLQMSDKEVTHGDMNVLSDEMEQLLERNIAVTFRGKAITTYEQVEEVILREDECCMRDYIHNDKEELIQVNFDVIQE